jgi:hypothetical protein
MAKNAPARTLGNNKTKFLNNGNFPFAARCDDFASIVAV